MDLRAWSLLCGAPTWPESLWPDLQRYVRPSRRDNSKLYRAHLPEAVVDECWDRFHHAIRPLQEAGRLGVVIARFPSWFTPRPSAWEELAALPSRLAGYRVAVELGSDRWFQRDACEQTLALLEQLGLCFVVQASPQRPQPIVAATSDLALVRFRGRGGWEEAKTAPEAQPPGGEAQDQVAWWSYRYSDQELASWAPAVRELASCTKQVHLIMDNCWRSDAVDNAGSLLEMLARA